jgi:hypothetical protein
VLSSFPRIPFFFVPWFFFPAALQSHELAAKLSQLTENQLALLEPLLDDDIVEAVQISSRIDGKNQGRRRQEQLIGKMLREYPGPGLGELEVRLNLVLYCEYLLVPSFGVRGTSAPSLPWTVPGLQYSVKSNKHQREPE